MISPKNSDIIILKSIHIVRYIKMTGTQRRQNVLAELNQATGPINATKLAEMNGVTRQIIVADIALLRAAGHNIRAEHRGYVLDRAADEMRKKIVCKHSKDGLLDEFYTIVDNGGKVIDVQVEHSIYGVISADMSVSSRFEADEFARAVSESGATQLSDLTGGIHVHTIAVKDESTFERICAKLDSLGILVKD